MKTGKRVLWSSSNQPRDKVRKKRCVACGWISAGVSSESAVEFITSRVIAWLVGLIRIRVMTWVRWEGFLDGSVSSIDRFSHIWTINYAATRDFKDTCLCLRKGSSSQTIEGRDENSSCRCFRTTFLNTSKMEIQNRVGQILSTTSQLII